MDDDSDFYAQLYKLNGMYYFEQKKVNISKKYLEYTQIKKYTGTYQCPFKLIVPRVLNAHCVLFREHIHMYHQQEFAYKSVTHGREICFKNAADHTHVRIWYHSFFVDKTKYPDFSTYQRMLLFYFKVKNL